jgi:DNA-binding CsgD family transcriptional regulator
MRVGKERGSRICELESASLLSAVSLIRGDVTEARRRISLGGRPGLEELAHVPVLTLVRGWLMAEEGDAALAIRLLTPMLTAAQNELDPWPWKPGWLPMLAHIGIGAADPAFASRAVELAEEGASRNRGVATFEAIATGLRGLLDHDLDRLALAAQTVTQSPRALIQAGIYADYGRAQLAVGDLAAGGELLDHAWAVYDQVGALAARSGVQRTMRAAGLHRTWWPAGQPRPSKGWNALTEAEMRVARLIGDGQTNKSAAAELGVSANTIGTHLRSVFSKLGVQSRVQLTNLLHAQDDALARASAQPLE